jgi:hypothetical protein
MQKKVGHFTLRSDETMKRGGDNPLRSGNYLKNYIMGMQIAF